MARPKVFLYVQNLLGIGHLRRAAAIARAAVAEGFDVAFVSGGIPVPHLDIGGARFVQLPPVRTIDDNFKVLVDEYGHAIDDAWRGRRRDALLDVFEIEMPDILLTELFPFGRRQFRFELLPLLERAKISARPLKIVCSMRDILVTKSRLDRNLEIVKTIHKYYDRILVHGDEAVITLAETFPMHDRITQPLEYTGYVLTPTSVGDTGNGGTGEIVVSAGGGAVGRVTLPEVFRLRCETSFADRPWRFVTGYHMPEGIVDDLVARAAPDVTVERSRPDLPALIERSDVSISQAGYNTIAELMAAGTPSVVIPFEGGIETEQRLRADLLAKRGRLFVVPEERLTAESLDKALREALNGGRRSRTTVKLDGARRTVAILRRLLSE
ncbi:MAG: glycosyl transferase [Rhodospirillaceae bacterium]|nr:glycosyl transferase [Rhodospirillaceae bacterium]